MSEPKEKVEKKEENYPQSLKEKDVKTKVTSLKKVIEDKLAQLKDLGTVEFMLPVEVRLKKRMEKLKEMSSAQSIKVQGHWKTVAQEMHVCNLRGHKVTNDEMRITFGVFAVDDKGNKKPFEHVTQVKQNDGSMVERVNSIEYKVEYEVTEIIRTNKPLKREVMKIDNGN